MISHLSLAFREFCMKLFKYKKKGLFGGFDYDRYKAVQIKGNIENTHLQWVNEETIRYISSYIRNVLGPVKFGLCHGTRRGLEQTIFRDELDCDVIGTEISPTAKDFPYTIQWDFHDVKPEWLSKCDFIYSNSWDHSYDPNKLFRAWFSCLRPGGLCFLEHTKYHTAEGVTEMDPLGLEREELVELLNRIGANKYAVSDILTDCPSPVGIDGLESKPVYIVVRANS